MKSLFKLIHNCTRTIDFGVAILVLLFWLLTGKYWLGKASLSFCEINTVMSIFTY